MITYIDLLMYLFGLKLHQVLLFHLSYEWDEMG